MRHIRLLEVIHSGQSVSAEHFGGNVVFTRNTENGIPDPENQLAHRELDISVVRYPAGQPDIAYREGLLIDGALPEHLVNFLTASQLNGQKVVIVTPTHDAYNGPENLAPFTNLLMQKYGDVIHAFEIGNEYWNHQSETSYGQVANESILAIADGLAMVQGDVPIWVQMGDAGGIRSEFNNRDDIGWLWRNIEANNTILDQLSTQARAEIDGLVEHYYFRDQSQYFGDITNDQNIQLDRAIWESALSREVSLNLTEWNIRTTNLEQLGMKAASTLIAQFSFMMEIQVDEAYVWPPMHNTSNDLAGGDTVILDGETGIVINSIGGATFDLMSSSLVGMEYLPSFTSSSNSDIQQYVFSDNQSVVVYLTSRSNDIENISFDLSQVWDAAVLRSAIQVGYDQSSSDGRHYDYSLNRFVDSQSVIVNTQEYHINEHDVRASINVHDVNMEAPSDNFSIELLPYEVIELVYSIQDQPTSLSQSPDTLIPADHTGPLPTLPIYQPEPRISGIPTDNAIFGDQNSNTLSTNEANNVILAGGGHDQIRSGPGNDWVEGNDGNDDINGGDGHDQLLGGSGFDTIEGGSGQDTIDGGSFADSIFGGWGNDILIGGAGFDQIFGGHGNDSIWGGETADRIYGGLGDDWISAGSSTGFTVDGVWGEAGNDTVLGDAGFDFIDGGVGNDVLYGGNHADNLFGRDGFDTLLGGNGLDRLIGGGGDDHLYGGEGNDGHFGGMGNDTLWGANGNDRFFGERGDDAIDGGADDDTIFGGSGFDTLIGNAGNDLIFGNFNADLFVFQANHGQDTIGDFSAENLFEKIDFKGLHLFGDFQGMLGFTSQIGRKRRNFYRE